MLLSLRAPLNSKPIDPLYAPCSKRQITSDPSSNHISSCCCCSCVVREGPPHVLLRSWAVILGRRQRSWQRGIRTNGVSLNRYKTQWAVALWINQDKDRHSQGTRPTTNLLRQWCPSSRDNFLRHHENIRNSELGAGGAGT